MQKKLENASCPQMLHTSFNFLESLRMNVGLDAAKIVNTRNQLTIMGKIQRFE